MRAPIALLSAALLAGATPVADRIAEALQDLNDNKLPHLELLPREFEIFIQLANGESIEQISDKLHLSPKTAANYQASIRKKLNLNSTLDLDQYASDHGMLDTT